MKSFPLPPVKFTEYDEMPPNLLEEAERFRSSLFHSNGWSRRGKLASSIKLYRSAKLNFRLKASLVTNWNRKIKRRFSNFGLDFLVSCSLICCTYNPSDWLGGIKLNIVELILSNCFFFSFQDNSITVPFIKKLTTEWRIYAILSHFFGLNLSSPAICHIYLAAVDGQKTY